MVSVDEDGQFEFCVQKPCRRKREVKIDTCFHLERWGPELTFAVQGIPRFSAL